MVSFRLIVSLQISAHTNRIKTRKGSRPVSNSKGSSARRKRGIKVINGRVFVVVEVLGRSSHPDRKLVVRFCAAQEGGGGGMLASLEWEGGGGRASSLGGGGGSVDLPGGPSLVELTLGEPR